MRRCRFCHLRQLVPPRRLRELKEEAGADKAVILRELDEWFALRFTGTDADIDLTAHDPEFAIWRWASMEELPSLIVPFKRDTYKKVIAAFKDLATLVD